MSDKWLFKKKRALASVRRGLKQKAEIARGSFAIYVEEELYSEDTCTVGDVTTVWLK